MFYKRLLNGGETVQEDWTGAHDDTSLVLIFRMRPT